MFAKVKQFVWGLSIIALVSVFLVSASPTAAADSVWQAKYWNNRTLSGDPVITRSENNLDHDWGSNAPDAQLDRDQFSARWTRTINVPSGASYRFTATMDDGMRVYVDNVLIIDSWTDSQVHSLTADVYLNTGDHALKVEYYEAGGQAVAKLSWTQIGGNAAVPIANWKGEYFNNSTLSGNPVLVRDDARIDFDWGTGSPAWNVVAADQFSARWTRTVNLDGGRYRITARADDGVRVWANGRLIIDEWHNASGQFYIVDVDLPAGAVPFQMEFYENVGGAVAFMDFYRLGSSSSANGGSWRGEYFNNLTLSGVPAVTRDDATLNFNWGNGAPVNGINSNDFSARWTRNLSFVAGRYRFTATSDDGVRVWVNGQQVINNWTDHPPQTVTGEITLAAGTYPVQVEYYERVGGAQIQVSWSVVNTTPTTPAQPATPTTGTGTVVSPLLNVRRGPGFEYDVITTLAQGATVSLAGYRSANSNWVMINFNGVQAWVSGKTPYLSSPIPVSSMAVWQGTVPTNSGTTNGQTAVVAYAYYVNMRLAPQLGNNIVTAVPAGTTVQLLGRNATSTWAKIQLPNLTTGWMSTSYLNTTTVISSLPVVN